MHHHHDASVDVEHTVITHLCAVRRIVVAHYKIFVSSEEHYNRQGRSIFIACADHVIRASSECRALKFTKL